MGYCHDESGYSALDRITRDSPLTVVTFMLPTLRCRYPAGTGPKVPGPAGLSPTGLGRSELDELDELDLERKAKCVV